MEKITYTLKRPIEVDGKTITEVVFEREPNVGDLAAADAFKGGTKKSAAILASLTGVTIQAIYKITSKDFVALNAILAPLLGFVPEELPGEE